MVHFFFLLSCAATADAENGEVLYAAKCVACHGEDGKLGVETDGTTAADLALAADEQSDGQIADVVMHGTGSMPAQYGDADDAADVAAFVKATF